jgi:hypothetical protein
VRSGDEGGSTERAGVLKTQPLQEGVRSQRRAQSQGASAWRGRGVPKSAPVKRTPALTEHSLQMRGRRPNTCAALLDAEPIDALS